MKKIIEVSSDTNIGGAGKCLLTLLENFNYDDFEVKVILPPDSMLKPCIYELGIPVIEVEGIADKSLDFKSIIRLKKIFDDEMPDLVHTHASMSARIAARHSGAKVVYTRHSVFPPSRLLTSFPGKQLNGILNNFYSDGIIAVAEAAKDNLTETGVKESNSRYTKRCRKSWYADWGRKNGEPKTFRDCRRPKGNIDSRAAGGYKGARLFH